MDQEQLMNKKPLRDTISLWMHLKDRRQVDLRARFCGPPSDADLASCRMWVTVLDVIGTHVIVAVLQGQGVDPTLGIDVAGN